MVKSYVHLDIGNTITQAKAWSRSGQGLRLVGSSAAPTPPALESVDLTESANLAYTQLKAKVERAGQRFDAETSWLP